MSLTIASGDLLNVRLNYGESVNVDRAFNVLHYKVISATGAPPSMSTVLGAIGAAMYNKWSALWAPGASQDIFMSGCTVTDVFPLPRSVAATYTPGSAVSGGQASEAIPLQDSPTLLKTTDVGQRWGLGRLFYVGVPENGQNQGNITLVEGALLQAMAGHLGDNVSVTSGGWSAVLGPVLVRGPEDNPTSLTTITGGRLSDTVIKSQKRRRPGKGI